MFVKNMSLLGREIDGVACSIQANFAMTIETIYARSHFTFRITWKFLSYSTNTQYIHIETIII